MTAPAELRRQRVAARLAVYEGLLRSLTAVAAYAHLLYSAAGVTVAQWEALGYDAREKALRDGRENLLSAAGVSRRDWDAMPRYSQERADVLLRGAQWLGIDTTWAGWLPRPERTEK